MILTSSCSTLTSISSPSNPLMTTSSASDGSIHGVFMVLVLSCDEPSCSHHEHHCRTRQQIYTDLPVILRRGWSCLYHSGGFTGHMAAADNFCGPCNQFLTSNGLLHDFQRAELKNCFFGQRVRVCRDHQHGN